MPNRKRSRCPDGKHRSKKTGRCVNVRRSRSPARRARKSPVRRARRSRSPARRARRSRSPRRSGEPVRDAMVRVNEFNLNEMDRIYELNKPCQYDFEHRNQRTGECQEEIGFGRTHPAFKDFGYDASACYPHRWCPELLEYYKDQGYVDPDVNYARATRALKERQHAKDVDFLNHVQTLRALPPHPHMHMHGPHMLGPHRQGPHMPPRTQQQQREDGRVD